MPTMRACARVALLIAILFALLSCATAPDIRDNSTLVEFLTELEGAEATEAVAMSRMPFLFDLEVLIRDGDLGILWAALKEGNFSLADARIDNILPTYDPSILGEGFLPQAFARSIAEQPISVVDIESRSGSMMLLIERTGFRSFALRGIRRPM